MPDVLDLGLVPAPRVVQLLGGQVTVDAATTLSALAGAPGDGVVDAADLLREYLAVPLPSDPDGDVTLRLDPSIGAPGAYQLSVDEGVELTGADLDGLRSAVQTLRQLRPAADGPAKTYRLPRVRIEDEPRFAWRGALLDVGRWYRPLDYLYRFIDALALHKLNRLHLHLTEDQGWRFEVRRYPKLTEIGAWRSGSPVGHARDGVVDDVPHGGSYPQEELRALVAFAARRGVQIVPEIDLPGHVTAVLAAYPEFGNGAAPLEVARTWGVHTTVLNAEESTLQFCRDVLDEVLDVFPSPQIHIGGDECPTDEWRASPRAAERATELGLAGPAQLQSWFTTQLCAHVSARGRTPVVWDEALGPTLPTDAIVMAWRDTSYGWAAAAQGHDVVMNPGQRTYFDYYQSDAPGQPLAIGGLTTLRDVIEYDPCPPDTPAALAQRIIGTQGSLWTEYLPTADRLDDMAWPRLAALAEDAWCTTRAPVDEVRQRIAVDADRLMALGIAGRTVR